MRFISKLIVSILIIFGSMSLGALAFWNGLKILQLPLLVAAIIGVGAIWRPRKNKSEGDIFKNINKLDKS